MKLNKKIIIPALSLLAGASLVGSVSGTIAWYQYSTRANVSYIGSSAGVIGNLQVKLATDDDSKWGPQVRTEDVKNYLSAQHIGQEVEPVTPGALEKNGFLKELEFDSGVVVDHGDNDDLAAILNPTEGQLFVKAVLEDDPANPSGPQITVHHLYKYAPVDIDDADPWKESNEIALNPSDSEKAAHQNDPKYQYIDTSDFKLYSKQIGNDKDFYLNPTFGRGPYSKWFKASEKNYVTIPLQLRFVGNTESDLKAQDIYLSKLLIQKDRENGAHKDIADAIRVHFSAYEDGDEINAINHLVSNQGGSTATAGRLKLGRGSDFDQAYEDENDVWGFNENNEYKYVQYGAGSQNSYGAFIDEKEGVYYESDESTPTTKSWKAEVSTVGEAAKTANDGNPGDLYIKKIGVGTENEARELYKKQDNLWKEVSDDTVVKTGTVLPTTDLGCTYYIREYNSAFYKLYKYENSAWEEDTIMAEFDDQEAVALDELRLDKANMKLMSGERGEWALVDADKYEWKNAVDLSGMELTKKSDGYVEDKLYIDSNDNLYRFVGGVYKETISPVLVKENVNPNNSLEIGELSDDKIIAKTTEGHIVNVDVTIWVEGWHKFNNGANFSSIWDSDYIESVFDVGMQFAVQDLRA